MPSHRPQPFRISHTLLLRYLRAQQRSGAPSDAESRLQSWVHLSAIEAYENVKWNLAAPGSSWPLERSMLGKGVRVLSAHLTVDGSGIQRDKAGYIKAVSAGAVSVRVKLSSPPDFPGSVDEAYCLTEIEERAAAYAKAGVIAWWTSPAEAELYSVSELAGMVAVAVASAARRPLWQRSYPEDVLSACATAVVDHLVGVGVVRSESPAAVIKQEIAELVRARLAGPLTPA